MEDFFVAGIRRVVFPAVGCSHRRIQCSVRHVQPLRAFVVEIGQGTPFQVFLMAGFCQRAFRKARFFFLPCYDPFDPFRRVQPVFAQGVQVLRRSGDCVVGTLFRPFYRISPLPRPLSHKWERGDTLAPPAVIISPACERGGTLAPSAVVPSPIYGRGWPKAGRGFVKCIYLNRNHSGR